MAKAAAVPGLRAEDSFTTSAGRIVSVRTRELFEHSEGVLDIADIERVHDMRVASRRLRAALEIFAPCFDPAQFDDVLRDVKRLADALGERRDPDVQIAAMQEYWRAADKLQRPGIRLYLQRLKAQQLLGNETLAAALGEAEANELRARLDALAESAMPDASGNGAGR